jgi:hypothetical protein
MNDQPIAISHSERVIPRTTTSFGVDNQRLITILSDVEDEFKSAVATFPPFNSAHEGWAVIYEELVVELFNAIIANKGGTRTTDNPDAMRKEAIQVAAMAVRFVHDICDRE